MLRKAFDQTYQLSRQARQGYPEMPGQWGIPAALDLILFAFHEAGGVLHEACTEAKAEQVLACQAVADSHQDKVVFQIESVAAISMMTTAGDQPKAAAWLASLLTMLPRRCPGVSFTVHLCDGDWGHEAMSEPESALPLVLLANEIAAQWPAEARLLGVQLPFAAAAKPPSLDPAWYDTLSLLKLGEAFLAAGFVHELLPLEDLRVLQATIEETYGGPVVLAPPCGLGRRPDPDQARDVLHKLSVMAFPVPYMS
jgi:hypothetical protein